MCEGVLEVVGGNETQQHVTPHLTTLDIFHKKLILSRREVIISQQQQTMCQVCSIRKNEKNFTFWFLFL